LTDPLEIILDGCRAADLSSQEKLYKYCYPEMLGVDLIQPTSPEQFKEDTGGFDK
jgi:hypothetical protein